MQKLNDRTSFYSRKRFPRQNSLRFVRVEGKVVLDVSGHQPGRGAYLLKEEVPLVLKEHAFGRAFRCAVSPLEEEAIKKAYEQLS
jgi:predicted RNA-binding protein YlxR (DUF448 family)